MDKDQDSPQTNDLDICCSCEACQVGRKLKGVAEPTPEQRKAAFTRLTAASNQGEDTLKVIRHAVENLFRELWVPPMPPVAATAPRIDWFGEAPTSSAKSFDKLVKDYALEQHNKWNPWPPSSAELRTKRNAFDAELRGAWRNYDPSPFLRPGMKPTERGGWTSKPAQTKASLTLDVFEQLKLLINDAGWNDDTDKQIALLRLQECKLLWEADNDEEGL